MLGEFGRLDKETSAFIEKHIDSFVKWDLVTFFSFNPDFTGTTVEIAGRLGREEADVKDALDSLVGTGLLKRETEDGRFLYSYEPSDETKGKVTSFVRCLEDRTLRLQILAKLLSTRSGQSGE